MAHSKTEPTTDDGTDDRIHEDVPGGELVYERVRPGVREAIGVANVTDWDELTEAAVARGLDRGWVLHADVLD